MGKKKGHDKRVTKRGNFRERERERQSDLPIAPRDASDGRVSGLVYSLPMSKYRKTFFKTALTTSPFIHFFAVTLGFGKAGGNCTFHAFIIFTFH